MGDGDFIVENFNSSNTILTQMILVELKMDEEDHCIILLFYSPYSWDTSVMGIGSTANTIVLNDVMVSLLSKEV